MYKMNVIINGTCFHLNDKYYRDKLYDIEILYQEDFIYLQSST